MTSKMLSEGKDSTTEADGKKDDDDDDDGGGEKKNKKKMKNDAMSTPSTLMVMTRNISVY